MLLEINDKDFKEQVLESKLPVVIDMWAPWCMPCNMLAPVVEKLSKEFDGKVRFCKLNVDNNHRTAQEYGAVSIPLLLFFKNGEKVDESLGAVPEELIRPKVEALL